MSAFLTNNNLYETGTIFVAPGGGGAPTPLPPGASGQVLGVNPSYPLGIGWGAGSDSGNVVGPVSSTAHHFAGFADTSGVLLENTAYSSASFALNLGSASTAHHIVKFANTDGQTLEQSTVSENAGVMTFPAGGGNVLTAGGGAARKGTFTLTDGLSGNISTTAAVTGCVIVVNVQALGTVSSPQAMVTTVTNGSKFVITSADLTDTSSGTWAIVG